MGFAIGLSGALMPGPLFVYTVHESLTKGKWTGAKVILGHAIVEAVIFLLLVFGLLSFAQNPLFVKTTNLVGGAAMMIMAALSLKGLNATAEEKLKKTGYGLIAGGIIFTALNPGFPIWWLTAGSTMLLEAFRQLGMIGMIIVLVGHWGADLSWFLFVSMTTSKSRHLLKEGGYKKIRILLSLILFGLGIFFLSNGI